MIYLSAQPDDYYLLWQLQLFNFNELDVILAQKTKILLSESLAKENTPTKAVNSN